MIDYEWWMFWPLVGLSILAIRLALQTTEEHARHNDSWERIAWYWKIFVVFLVSVLWPIVACEILWIGLKKSWGMLKPPKT